MAQTGKGSNTSRLLIHEQPLQVLPALAIALGLNEAIILQQLHYWLLRKSHIRDGREWHYNTYEDWKKQFPFWSVSTIKRAILSLQGYGVITAGNYNNSNIDKTKWYAINYEKLNDLCAKSTGQDEPSTGQDEPSTGQDEPVHGSLCPHQFPETNTETTSEKKDPPISPQGETEEVWQGDGTIGKGQKATRLSREPAKREQLKQSIINANFLAWFATKGLTLDLDDQWENFTSKALAKGYKYVDWHRAFMNWLTSPYQHPSTTALSEEEFARALEEAQRNGHP